MSTPIGVNEKNLAKLNALFADLPPGARILVETYSDNPQIEWVIPSLEEIFGPARAV